MRTDTGTRMSVVVLAKEGNKLKAVELVKQGETFEVLWTKRSEDSSADWETFAVECGLSIGPLGRAQDVGDKMSVVGFDSAGVGFYRIGVPSAREEEISAMVRLQAEALLPLSAKQMELAWRTGRVQDGQIAVTIAAARREPLQRFVSNVEAFKPAKILLSCEGVVKVWRTFFGGNNKTSVVVNLSSRSTQICLAEEGRLSNAVALDMGMEDLITPEGLTEQTQASERFAQDMKSVLGLFGYAEPAELPIFVLSDGSSAIEAIVSSIRSAGLNTAAALPDAKGLKTKTGLDVDDIYEYRVPLGLGLCAFDGDLNELNIFKRIYKPPRVEEKKHWLYSPKAAGVIAAAMLVLLILVSYVVDVTSPKSLEKRLLRTDSSADIGLLEERQKLMKIVAQQRPDLLELLNQVSAGGEEGIMLDSLHFKKGQTVNITGQAQSSDQLYKFQENLLSHKDIKEVRIQNASKDNKEGKIKFTITFHYKNFTRKGLT